MNKIDLALIHEEGHAKAIIDVISKSNDPRYCPSTPPLILIGDYKNKKPYSFKHSEVCNANIIYYPFPKIGSRALTLHPCMDFMNNDEIKLCARAGYDAERAVLSQNKDCKKDPCSKDYNKSSDKKYFEDPDSFKNSHPRGFDTYTDAFNFYNKIYQNQLRIRAKRSFTSKGSKYIPRIMYIIILIIIIIFMFAIKPIASIAAPTGIV